MGKQRKSSEPSVAIAWIDAPKNYKLGILDGKVVCQNPSGGKLASLPSWLKEEATTDQLQALCTWLEEHQLECLHTAERWMLRSLTLPEPVIREVWPDPDWRNALQNMVVAPADDAGQMTFDRSGLLRDVDSAKGLGVVDADGETAWLKADFISIPHPILIPDLEEIRELAADLGIRQQIEQLYRPVYQPTAEQRDLNSISDFARGAFDQLNFALGACRRFGYPVRGGYATCKVWEGGFPIEARYFIGAESPDSPTETGELIFVNARQEALPIRDVGPVTFSEGMRMASAIYGKRKIEKKEGEA